MKRMISLLLIVTAGFQNVAFSQSSDGNAQILEEVTNAKKEINCAKPNMEARACKANPDSCQEDRKCKLADEYARCLATMAQAIETILAKVR